MGRIITLEFENYYLIGTYVVNAGRELKVRSHIPRPSPRTENLDLDLR
jgi:AP endonuclease-1